MRKSSNFKNITFTNYEFISVIILLMFSNLIGKTPKSIITDCCAASTLGSIFLSIVAYIIFKILIKYVFKREFDFFEIIKKTYPRWFCKLIGIILYLFFMFYTYIVIGTIIFNLKSTTYAISTIPQIAIYFLLALFFMTHNGFNTIFRIAGYISGPLVLFMITLFVVSIPYLDINQLFPLFGMGIKNVFFLNLRNISIFSQFFLILLFGGSIQKYQRFNLKNYNKIFVISALPFIIIIAIFTGSMTSEFIQTRSTLVFDISRIVAFTTTSIKLAPLMISFFSFISFIISSFLLLTGCMSLERLNVIKDYSKIVAFSNLIIVILYLVTPTLYVIDLLEDIFSYVSIGICIIFPIITVIIYSIKDHKIRYNLNPNIALLKEVSYYEE